MLTKLRALFGRDPKPPPAKPPPLTYRKAGGGWYATFLGETAFGLTKRDAAQGAMRAAVRASARHGA